MGPMRQKSSLSFFTKLLNKIQNIFALLKNSDYIGLTAAHLNFHPDIALKKIENIKNDILSLCSPTPESYETNQNTANDHV